MTGTILMIHGYGMTGDSWRPVAEAFRAAGYAVETPTIRPDLRTAAAPPAALARLTLADYVADMGALARHAADRDGERPIVFGHSMGGLIAQKLAEAGLASAIVLFAPASPSDARGRPRLSPVFTFLNAALTPGAATRSVRMWRTGFDFGVVNAVPAERREALYALGVHDSGRVLQDIAYPDRDEHRTAQVDAAKVTVPVMVLAGQRDRTTPVDDVRLVGRKYAGADYREYPDHAHWLIDEPGSAVLLDAVRAWLADNGLAPNEETAAPKPAPKAKPKARPEAKAVASPVARPKAEPSAPASPEAVKPRAPAKAKIPSRAKAVAAQPGLKPAKTAAKPPAGATSTSAKTSPRRGKSV